MARVRTFRAWRYSTGELDITPLTSPPYDVISDAQRAEFAAEPHNVVALELPDGSAAPDTPGNRYENSRSIWEEWRAEGVLSPEPSPSLYVLEQRFELGGMPRTRRAFVVEVGLEPFDAGVVLPHERTLPKALGDRYELIKATAANFSPVFALFEDAECSSARIFDEAVAGAPVATATGVDGVHSTLWACPDSDLARGLTELMSTKQLFIADGHHRYTTALAYRDLMRAQAAVEDRPIDANAPSEYVLMALVNMDDPDLTVLPYHRVADGTSFNATEFRVGLERNFELSELPPGHPSSALEGQARASFLVKTSADERPVLAVLRPEVDPVRELAVERSDAWKSLDVAIVQELVLWPLLSIHPDRPETLDRLRFTNDAHEALKATAEHDVAIVMRPTKLADLRAVSLAGETMPQKSTYFYPKLLSGMLFRSAE